MQKEIVDFVSSVSRRTLTNQRQRSLHTLVRLQAASPTGWVSLGALRSAKVTTMSLRDLRRERYENLDVVCERTSEGVFYRLSTRHLSLQKVQRILQG